MKKILAFILMLAVMVTLSFSTVMAADDPDPDCRNPIVEEL